MKTSIHIPALSPELFFYLGHATEMDALYENEALRSHQRLGLGFGEALVKVYDRAYEDLRHVLPTICDHISKEIRRYAHINWKDRTLEKDWGCWGYPRIPRKRSNQGHWTGVYLDCDRGTPRILLVLGPAGGRGGRRWFVEQFRAKWRKAKGTLVLTEDHPDTWSEWASHPCIVYHIHKLSPSSSIEEICSALSQVAQQFFRLAMPVLNKMK